MVGMYQLKKAKFGEGCLRCMFNWQCRKNVLVVKKQAAAEGWSKVFDKCGGAGIVTWRPLEKLKRKRF